MNVVGRLLVAPPAQEDDFWSESVIYIYEQNQASVVGIVLNKPSDKTVSDLAEHHGFVYPKKDLIHLGGPVNSSALVMLHTDDWICSNTMHIEGNLRVSSDKSMLKRICNSDTPQHWRMFLGMAGWIPTQLEGEISGTPPWSKKTAWLLAPADQSIIFEKHPEKMWKRAIDSAVQEMTESYFSIN